MKAFRDVVAAACIVFASALVVFNLVVKPYRAAIESSRAARRQCELARMDAAMLVGFMFSPSALDRDSVHGVYDYVRLEQRQCALFTVPAIFHCQTDGCRAAELASMNVVMP